MSSGGAQARATIISIAQGCVCEVNGNNYSIQFRERSDERRDYEERSPFLGLLTLKSSEALGLIRSVVSIED